MDFLAQFPLNMVAFPGQSVNLHIFEPRYRQLIQDCDTEGVTFGIPAFIDKNIMEIGTELKLDNIEKVYPDGKMDVKTTALGRYRILEFFNKATDKLYATAKVSRLEETHQGRDLLLNEQLYASLQHLFQLLNLNKPLPESISSFSSFDIAHQVGLDLQQEYELLSIDSEYERQLFLTQHFKVILPKVKEIAEVRRKAAMNGHFRNILPPDF